MMKRRILSVLLSLTLIIGLAPMTAFAEDSGKAGIQLGVSSISGYDSTNGYDYIYMGNWTAPDSNTISGPIKWRVLDDQTNTGGTGLFLLSEVLLGSGANGDVYFYQDMVLNSSDGQWYTDSTYTVPANEWQDSDAQAWCKDFAGIAGNSVADAFSEAELTAILETTKTDSAIDSYYGTSSLNAEKVFFLSREEVLNTTYGFSGKADKEKDTTRIANYGSSSGRWWLRSPVGNSFQAGTINNGSSQGKISYTDVNFQYAARPAFNLNTAAVLFTSAATGGKAVGALGTMGAVSDYTGNEWKLTLKDSSRSFSANTSSTTTAEEGYSNWTVEVTYSGAQTGDKEYVSAMIVDSNDNILYYGQIATNNASGTASLTIPAELGAGEYTLKVFSEQINGDKATDYASGFVNIALTVTAPPHSHQWTTDWTSDDTCHWHECTVEGCPITNNAEKDSYATHTPNADDGDCSTAITCSVCNAVITAAQEHSFTNNASDQLVSAANCQHKAVYKVQCDNCSVISDTVTVEVGELGDHSWDIEWSADGNHHWHKCLNSGCTEMKDKAEHTSTSDNVATQTDKAKCDVCGREYGELLPPIHYTITQGNEQKVAKGNTLTVTSNADFDKFVRVEVDGKEIAASNYTAVSGSTKVTLKAAYIETLSTGEHTLTVVSEDGEASTTFTVEEKATTPDDTTRPDDSGDSDTDVPQTGDNSHMALWFGLMFVSVCSLVVLLLAGKKRRSAR